MSSPSTAGALRPRLRQALAAAMKARDLTAVADDSAAPRRHLSETSITSIVQAEVSERQSAAAEYEQLGRKDDAERLRSKAAVLIAHLGQR